MAFLANDKMLVQLSYTKKTHRVQIWAQIKNVWSHFLLFSNFGQNYSPNFEKNVKNKTYNLLKDLQTNSNGRNENKNSDNFEPRNVFKYYIPQIK